MCVSGGGETLGGAGETDATVAAPGDGVAVGWLHPRGAAGQAHAGRPRLVVRAHALVHIDARAHALVHADARAHGLVHVHTLNAAWR